ncbi:MAG: multidrug ABC transporter ATP-binding protein [Verrucomicrobiales bacterium]|nr:multidrug ABC transporter ATP-binding protein [Verrucomicrobiales bacterium]|tara:strand:+ start:2390 stop:4231 length:1842 start_codon:yes stop_codon:yes gene_type:complete
MQNLLKIWKFGWPYLRKYWGRFAIGVVLGLIFGATNLGFVWVVKTLTGRIDPSQPVQQVEDAEKNLGRIEKLKATVEAKTDEIFDEWLPKAGHPLVTKQVVGILLTLPLLMAARGFTGYFSSYCLIWVSEQVVHDLRMQVIDKFNSLSMDFFNRAKMGDLITRVSGDTAMLQRMLSLVFSDLIKEPATIIWVFTGMVIISWKLSMFVLIFLPLIVLPLIVFGRKVKKATVGNVKATIDQTSLLVEAASGIRVVKAFNLEDQQKARFQHHSGSIRHHNMKAAQARELVNPCIETISMVGLALLIVVVFKFGIDMEDLVALVASVAILFTPIKKLGRVHVFIQQTSVGVERLFSLVAEKPSVKESEHPGEMARFSKSIELLNLSFSYGDEVVLKNVALSIPHGHKLGIAGASGSGKSTLINLFLRFYDPTDGAIQIDGQDFRSVRMRDLRDQMALVSQEVMVFDMSIADNIACGRPDATREEIEAAAKDAFAHEFITQLPQGYETKVGERGVTLSGGQRQRLAIARAFVKNAPILLLDEATAALDSKAEEEVQKGLERLEENRTVICIAHRLATLSEMDRIIILRAGRIVEEGGYHELIKRGGEFAEMARRQGIT